MNISASWRKSSVNDYVKKNSLHAKEQLNRKHGDPNNLERGRLISEADYKNGAITRLLGKFNVLQKGHFYVKWHLGDIQNCKYIFVNKKNACFYIFGLVVTLVILLASKRENSSQYTITILMLHVPLESNYWLSYCCWRSFALGELCLLGYQIMTLPYRKQSYSSAISTSEKNRTKTAVTNMMKQRNVRCKKIRFSRLDVSYVTTYIFISDG